jgi:hypothetical protein
MLTPMGGGILQAGGTPYGGILAALLQKYGRQAMDPMQVPPQQPDETAMAELLGLIPRQMPSPSMPVAERR